MNPIQLRYYIALTCFGLAKVLGMAAVACGYGGMRSLGVVLFILAFLFLGICVALALINAAAIEKKIVTEKDHLQKMMEDGTLKQYLKEIGYK